MTEWTEPAKPVRIDIGCDVARYGDDRTVIGYKVDEKAMFYKRKSGQDLMQTADDIMELGLKLMEKYRFDKAIPHQDRRQRPRRRRHGPSAARKARAAGAVLVDGYYPPFTSASAYTMTFTTTAPPT